MKYTFFLTLLIFTIPGYGQQSIDALKQDMAFYGDVLMNGAATKHRLRASDSLRIRIDQFLETDNSYSETLEDVPWVTVVKEDGSNFRILTWQINQADSIFSYGGRIQFANGAFVKLEDKKDFIEPLYTSCSAQNWYGARYSQIKSFVRNGQKMYLLFGFNAHSKWNRQKVLDVLLIDNGKPSFGAPVFTKKGKDADRYGQYRHIMTYSLDSRPILEYNEKLDMIVFDHLIPLSGRFPGQGQTYVSDGSYEGYKLDENGAWIYREKLFEEVIDEPLDDGRDRSTEKQKDIFGKNRQ